MNQPSILVVDDQPDNFDVIKTILSEQNYLLHYAVSGEEAIASLNRISARCNFARCDDAGNRWHRSVSANQSHTKVLLNILTSLLKGERL
ncbi:MAG: response regulator [Nostoc sp.]